MHADPSENKSNNFSGSAVDKSYEPNIDSSFKSPICCILGHVDTGKTKLLDKLRQTNVQGEEAGGITQQIGATFFPASELIKKCGKNTSKLPGLLVIDTPGHESFTNLRTRGSSLCNLAILVVDIVHGIEAQTLESIELLKARKTPFIVALNKIDRLYGWKSTDFSDFESAISRQSKGTFEDFDRRVGNTILAFAELGFNARLFSKNDDKRRFISLVPTSAVSGEGIPDLVSLILELSEKYMESKMKIKDELECTILEVKNVEGYGTTLDAILSNGGLKEGDKIALSGFNGVIITSIKALLMPQPLKELRVKSQYTSVKTARASIGIKILANDLDKAIAGSRILAVKNNEEEVKSILDADIKSIFSSIKLSKTGVHVVSSTLGSLEALTTFLSNSKILVSGVSIGYVKKKDVIIVASMASKGKEYASILCFDVILDKETKELAISMGIKILEAKIIYNLLDLYLKHAEDERNKVKEIHMDQAVFPVKLSIVPKCIFNARSPLVIGVHVDEGVLKIRTPLCVLKNGETVHLGSVTSIENNKEVVNKATKGQKVAIKIETKPSIGPRMFGRHFEQDDALYSVLCRDSISTVKKYFADELDDDSMKLLVKLENKFGIF
ncbi:eukaryotic translation initiation factor 5B [Ordospora colligata]